MTAVRDHGYRSALAVPLDLRSGAVAAMNFYAVEPGAFDTDDFTRALAYAAIASLVLSVAVRVATHADAFALLRDASSHRNMKLARLAEEVVAAVGGGESVTHFEV